MGYPRLELTKKRFGRYEVLSFAELRNRQTYWKCLCDCGNIAIVNGHSLTRGHTKSCGCLQVEELVLRSKKHDMSGSTEFRIWAGILQRCNNPNNHDYKYYGGRGITVCSEWESFEQFYKDMGSKPRGFTLDRINNNGNYKSENCKWASRKEQANNTRRNRPILYNGEIKPISHWVKELGLSSHTVYRRLNKGYNIDEVFYKGNLKDKNAGIEIV